MPPESTIKFITLSSGRSGSGMISSAIGYLMNGESGPYLEEEIFGSNTRQMREVREAVNLLRESFCGQEKKYPRAKVVGIKWKPYFENEMYDKAWRFVKNNHVRVVHNRRNELDVCLSKMKHKQYPSLQSHYSELDAEGLSYARNIMGLNIDVSELLRVLSQEKRRYESYENKIKKLGIPYLSVTYEDVISGGGKGLSSWKQIVNFLGGAGRGITSDKIKRAMGKYGKSTIKSQSEMILNYDEVFDALTGTAFEKLLK